MVMAVGFPVGLEEGGDFLGASGAVAEWFTRKERAKAMGIINAGTAVGAVVAPPLIAVVLSYSGWRWIFVVTGGLGLLWAWCWIASYAPPENHPEPAVREPFASASQSHCTPPIRWFDLL